jgi:hypothetical protein
MEWYLSSLNAGILLWRVKMVSAPFGLEPGFTESSFLPYALKNGGEGICSIQ